MTTKEKDEQEKNKQEEQEHRNSMNRVLLGGMVGASIGLLSSPEAGKKVITGLGKSEVMKVAGREIRRTAQEMITEQALITLRQSATGYLSKYEGNLLAPIKKKEDQSNHENNEENEKETSSQYEELKEENKSLNEKLERIEQMLNDLLDAKS
jgi:gas vesicle protein